MQPGEELNISNGIDGKEYRFGHDYSIIDFWKIDGNFEKFWSSGGAVWFSNGWSEEHVIQDRWDINVEDIPEQFRKYATEIDEEFNSNVSYGCCGGCV